MFKNGELEGETDEVISACDYSGILCKLAGIDYNYAGQMRICHFPLEEQEKGNFVLRKAFMSEIHMKSY